MNINRNFIVQENITSIRSQTLGFYDVHTLLLLNGRPLRDSAVGGLNFGFYNSFPIETIDRVELIRGPGSVLYGTNAYSGVVNIVTKDVKEQDGKSFLSLRAGNKNTREATFAGGTRYKDLYAYGAIRASETDSIEYDFTDEFGNSGTPALQRENYSAFANAEYNDFSFMGFLAYTDHDQVSPIPVLPVVRGNYRRGFYDIGHEHTLSNYENWTIKNNITFNTLSWNLGNVLSSTGALILDKSDDVMVETTLHGKINDKTNLLIGGTAEYHDGKVASQYFSGYRYNMYFQSDYKPTDNLKLIAGAQYNKIDVVEGSVVPRVAAIYHFNEHNGIKLQYGEAFRGGYGIETEVQFSTIVGNPSLAPEEIATYDAQIFRHTKNYNIALTAFHSRLSSIIKRESQGDGLPLKYQNQGIIYSRGLELEGKGYITKNWNILGSMSYQTSEDQADQEDTLVDPNFAFKLGVAYESDNGLTASFFNTHRGEPARLINDGVQYVNPDGDDYDLLTATLKMNVGKWTGNKKWNGIELRLQGDNLLDEAVYTPEIGRRVLNTVPQTNGRFISSTVSVRF